MALFGTPRLRVAFICGAARARRQVLTVFGLELDVEALEGVDVAPWQVNSTLVSR